MDDVASNNGVTMSQLGLGPYQVKAPAECEWAVGEAIDVGSGWPA